MLNKLLSFFSGRQITVNAQFAKQRMAAGELLEGKLLITNLSAHETLLQNLKIAFISSFQRPLKFQIEKENYLLFHALLRDKLTVLGSETCEMPFSFPIPFYMPVVPATALVKTSVSYATLQTAHDQDELLILPSVRVQALFDAFWELGFKHTALSGYVERHLQQPLQIFSLKPIKEPYLGKCKDVEFFVEETAEGLTIFMTINKMRKEFLGTTLDNPTQKYNKAKFFIAPFEMIDNNLLAYYIDKLLKMNK